MKILVVTHSYGLDGASAILKSALAYWAKLGWRVDALLNDQLLNAHGSELSMLGINPIVRTNTSAKYQFVLINTLTDLKHINYFYGKLPIVLWAHEGATFLHNYSSPPADLIRLFSKTSLIIFQTPWQSEVVYKSFLQQIPKEKIVCIPCGVEAKSETYKTPIKSPNAIRIVNLGSVYPRKRQLDLAQATINLSKKYLISCTFIGEFSHANAYGPKINDFLSQFPGILVWLGGLSDAEKLGTEISKATVGCFPSGDETFGIAPIEMALQKIPIVLADLPAYKEVGWKNEVNCLTFPVGNINALEKTLEKLINDPQLQSVLAQGGHELAKVYDMSSFYKKITNAVSSLS